MKIPEVFIDFSGFMYPHSNEKYANETDWISGTIEWFNDSQKQQLKAYVGELLSGRYSDADLAEIWRSTQPTFEFAPGGHRIFLKKVLEVLS